MIHQISAVIFFARDPRMEVITRSTNELKQADPSQGNPALLLRSLQKEIKQWERSFVKEMGRKPTSQDIRNKGMGKYNLISLDFSSNGKLYQFWNAAKKYKEYNSLKRELQSNSSTPLDQVTANNTLLNTRSSANFDSPLFNR